VTFPDRLSGLIRQLESGQPLARVDVRRVAQLQALDLLKIGEDFAREAIANERAATDEYAAILEAKKNG